MDFLFLIIYGVSVCVALGALLWACKTDFMTMTIPNGICITLGLAFVPAYASAWMLDLEVFSSLASHAAAVLVLVAISFGMFVLKVWGAGDSKLASAVALWIGLKGVAVFLMAMAIGGLLLALPVYAARFIPRNRTYPEGSWVARIVAGERNLPYGIAIALGGFAALVRAGAFDTGTILGIVSASAP